MDEKTTPFFKSLLLRDYTKDFMKSIPSNPQNPQKYKKNQNGGKLNTDKYWITVLYIYVSTNTFQHVLLFSSP